MNFFRRNEDEFVEQLRVKAEQEGISEKYPPVSSEVIELCEKFFGFKLPQLLRAVYSGVANGGIGPGDQLVGLSDGKRSPFDSKYYALDVIGVYDCFINYRLGWDELDDYGEMLWQWPLGLLPICDWGNHVISVVDCKSRDPRVILLDYSSSTTNYRKAYRKKESGAFQFPGVPLREWLKTWLDNGDTRTCVPSNWTERPPQRNIEIPGRPIVQVRRNERGLTTD
ncbi:SMI1/KNR4 family protein [Candidatus Obscuribacterales bacterium]|nr:SMI1/KNR4 family protein [Candidatus Obscuribacterales bacterium]